MKIDPIKDTQENMRRESLSQNDWNNDDDKENHNLNK